MAVCLFLMFHSLRLVHPSLAWFQQAKQRQVAASYSDAGASHLSVCLPGPFVREGDGQKITETTVVSIAVSMLHPA